MAMKVEGLKVYLSDYWNYIDLMGTLTFLVYFCMRIGNPENTLVYEFHSAEFKAGTIKTTLKGQVLVLMNVAIQICIWFKFTYLQKVNTKLGLLAALLLGVSVAVIPFLMILVFWVCFFASISATLGAN